MGTKENEKQWEELSLSNDFLFGKVMRNPKLCKKMLETILDIKIDRVEYPEIQKSIDEDKDARSVRLDVYVLDGKNTVYNVEIQTTDTKELPKRSRYYQSMLDLQQLDKGDHYRVLNTSYVIFICTFDAFGRGLYKYTFESQCLEIPGMELGDEATKIFLNTKGLGSDISKELKSFLNYLDGGEAGDSFTKELDREVRLAKKNREWRREYMTLKMRDIENVEKGIEQGIEQGMERGIEVGRREGRREGLVEGKREISTRVAANLYSDGMSIEKIAKMVGEPVETVIEMLKETGTLTR